MTTAVKAQRPKRKSSPFLGNSKQTDHFSTNRVGIDRRIHLRLPASSPDSKSDCASGQEAGATDALSQHPCRSYGWKRTLDLSCIALSLPVVLPLMALIVLWIRLVSRGPALFRQERVGRNGQRFVLYKFRSMKANCGTSRHETYLRHLVKSDSPMIKLDLLCDSRLIPGGCLLRAAGLDELPQLLNVIKGEMSLVGPRPCLPQEHIYFSTQQKERFDVLPGLTGSWQVSGKNRCTFSEMNVMDVNYARNASLKMDLEIMMKTPSALVHQLIQAAQQKLSARQFGRESDDAGAAKCDTQRIG